jgi:hypothetical protein
MSISSSHIKIVVDMLEIVKLFPQVKPDGAPTCDADAVTWLLRNPALLKKLSEKSEFSGFSTLADSQDIFAYYALSLKNPRYWFFRAHGSLAGFLLP